MNTREQFPKSFFLHSREEVAKELSVSRAMVYYIEKQALKKVLRALKAKQIVKEDFLWVMKEKGMFNDLLLWIKKLWNQTGAVSLVPEATPEVVVPKNSAWRKRASVKKVQPVLVKKKPAVKKAPKKWQLVTI